VVRNIGRQVAELELKSYFEYSEKRLVSPEIGSEGREQTRCAECLPNSTADIHCLPW
jgi:hypothetical protein